MSRIGVENEPLTPEWEDTLKPLVEAGRDYLQKHGESATAKKEFRTNTEFMSDVMGDLSPKQVI
jgi:hypothetical protein